MTATIHINKLKKQVFDGKKSREKLIGKKVKCIESDLRKQVEHGYSYTIKSISAGNYDAFLYFEELPSTMYSEYSRKEIPNCFNIDKFIIE